METKKFYFLKPWSRCAGHRQKRACVQMTQKWTALFSGDVCSCGAQLQGGGKFCTGIFPQGKIPHGENSAPVQKIKGKIPHLPNLQCIGSKRDPGIAIPKRSWEKAMTIVPEITSVDGVARHSQIIRLPAPPSLFVDNNCRRAGTKQMGARGEAQGIRWYGGLHGQNSARGKFRTSPRKMRGKFRTKLKYGIFPAEKSPRGITFTAPLTIATQHTEGFTPLQTGTLQ